MNDESLQRANAFLGSVARRVGVGEVMMDTPAEIGRELGFPDALSTARAVRALIARRRLEAASGSYRLLDARPVDPAEREAVGRRPRAARHRSEGRPDRHEDPAAGTYGEFGRAVVDRLIDLGRDNAEMRAELRSAREELRAARATRDDAERRARALGERVAGLEQRAEMAESNLRALLVAAKGQGVRPDAAVGDAEMAAILGVLKGDESETEAGTETVMEPVPRSEEEPSAPLVLPAEA
ncbi:MAG: hypothetical protein WD096_03110 [Actinomycetota bacterium]